MTHIRDIAVAPKLHMLYKIVLAMQSAMTTKTLLVDIMSDCFVALTAGVSQNDGVLGHCTAGQYSGRATEMSMPFVLEIYRLNH